MLPVTSAERALCTIYMLLSGCIWTYVLGTAAGIAATLDPNGVLFKTTMDQLNLFMRERNLPTESSSARCATSSRWGATSIR